MARAQCEALLTKAGKLAKKPALCWNLWQYSTASSDDEREGTSLRAYELHEDAIELARLYAAVLLSDGSPPPLPPPSPNAPAAAIAPPAAMPPDPSRPLLLLRPCTHTRALRMWRKKAAGRWPTSQPPPLASLPSLLLVAVMP